MPTIEPDGKLKEDDYTRQWETPLAVKGLDCRQNSIIFFTRLFYVSVSTDSGAE